MKEQPFVMTARCVDSSQLYLLYWFALVELFLPHQIVVIVVLPLRLTTDCACSFLRRSFSSRNHEALSQRSIADVALEYDLPFTIVERWFYTYSPDLVIEESASIFVWMSSLYVRGTTKMYDTLRFML